VRNHPEVTDAQISKLLGTTKATIEAVRDRTHWNSANLKPVDPVTLGLVGQLELDSVVRKAADKKAKDDARNGIVSDGPSLRPAGEAEAPQPDYVDEDEDRGARVDLKNVFANTGPAHHDEEDED